MLIFSLYPNNNVVSFDFLGVHTLCSWLWVPNTRQRFSGTQARHQDVKEGSGAGCTGCKDQLTYSQGDIPWTKDPVWGEERMCCLTAPQVQLSICSFQVITIPYVALYQHTCCIYLTRTFMGLGGGVQYGLIILWGTMRKHIHCTAYNFIWKNNKY